jgi:hypothetical protein
MNKRKESNLYETRVVAFLDILGFSELVQTGRQHDILDVMNDIETRFDTLERMKNPVDLTAFSDSIFLSAAPLDDDFGIVRLVQYVLHMVSGYFWRGILVRGGITIGDVYHKHPVVFGPALIAAYEIESQQAVYPRIVVEEEVMHRFVTSNHMQTQKVSNPQSAFRKDGDGLIHLEVFGPMCMQFPDSISGKGTLSDFQYMPAKKIVDDLLKEGKPVRVMQKLNWLRSYLDFSERTFGANTISIIRHD